MEPKKILIVDDEEIIRRFLQRILAAFYRLHLVQSVKEAKQAILDFKPDLLITDLKLPDGNGVEIIKHFRTVFPEKGIIVITGSPTPRDEFTDTKTTGALFVVHKPFEMEEFKTVVKNALEGKEPL